MLVEFRVENFRSLRDEQVLTMEVGRINDPSDSRQRQVTGNANPVLTSAALYGANASGKSNVIGALVFMKTAVVSSFRVWERDTGIPRSPFAWGGKPEMPSSFEATFLIMGKKYEYGFVVSNEAVLEEWLTCWEGTRKVDLFTRETNKFSFNKSLRDVGQLITPLTGANALFLSTASQHDVDQLEAVYSWFRDMSSMNMAGNRFRGLRPYYMINETFQFPFVLSRKNSSERTEIMTRIRSILQAADTGIVDVKTEETDEDKFPTLYFQHVPGDDDSWIPLHEESSGTKTLCRIADPLFHVLTRGGLLVVDELEASLHPILGNAIVDMFNCPEVNRNNAQLIFTTHDTNLLGSALGNAAFRRDQVWFTEKDKGGATKLYPLTDYKPRKEENLERGYLQGRYGAIPFYGRPNWINSPETGA